MSNPFPNRLRVIRQNAGYSQLHVARLLGHNNANALCKWENEVRMPNGFNLLKLCLLYGKTPQQLYPDLIDRIEEQFLEYYATLDGVSQTIK